MSPVVRQLFASGVTAGALDPRNAAYVIKMLDRACDGCTNGEFAAMVTAPVQKSTLMDAGFAFPGHTEYLASRTRAALPRGSGRRGRPPPSRRGCAAAIPERPRRCSTKKMRSTPRIYI